MKPDRPSAPPEGQRLRQPPAPLRNTLWVVGGSLALVLSLAWLASDPPLLRGWDKAPPPAITQAERQRADGSWEAVTLPDEVEAPDGPLAIGKLSLPAPAGVVTARYRVHFGLPANEPPGSGTGATGQALYAPGYLAFMRLWLNGQLLLDDLGTVRAGEALPPRPRGGAPVRLVELPASLLKPGDNRLEFEAIGRGFVSVSVLQVGDRQALLAARERKLMALVSGPVVVATVIGLLGLAMLLLWARRSGEAAVGYFGLGAVIWGVHTLWTVAPRSVLTGVHFAVGWTTMYAAMVVMLVLFALRFAQLPWRRAEHALLITLAAVPPALYTANTLGLIFPAMEGLRLGLVLLALAGLLVLARHAWYRRSLASAMFIAAAAASVAFGLRDWLVFRTSADNYPVPLTPYAGLPFILLVSWILIDRFVRTAESFEAINHGLEERVAQREAELADNFQRLTELERQQAANDERARILRELHDGLGAKLLSSLMRVQVGQLTADGLSQELQGCLSDMRLASETLTPGQADLAAAAGNLLFRWQTLLRDAGVQADWQVQLPDSGLPMAPQAALQVLRILQEALNNVLRHARASRVRLQMSTGSGQLKVLVEDNGVGLDAANMGQGRGLRDMGTRAEAVGGQLELMPAPGGGTQLRLTLPLALGTAAPSRAVT